MWLRIFAEQCGSRSLKFGQLISELSGMLRQEIIKMRFAFSLRCVGVSCAHKVLPFKGN